MAKKGGRELKKKLKVSLCERGIERLRGGRMKGHER